MTVLEMWDDMEPEEAEALAAGLQAAVECDYCLGTGCMGMGFDGEPYEITCTKCGGTGEIDG